jgi:hypothetical protein
MSTVINIQISLQAGNTYTLHIPTTLDNDGGYSPSREDITFNGETRTNHNGWWLENEDAGKIVYEHPDKVAIDYKQILPASNIIWFYAYTGERIRMAATPMTVHDHASIAQGGPAYGTYFSYVDDSTAEES